MSKQQLIEAIREKNRSAESDFLLNFSLPALENYLKRLTQVQGCRGPQSIWVRDGNHPALATEIR